MEFISQKIWTTLSPFIFIIICLYIVIVIAVYFFQPGLIFFPEREIYTTPDKSGFAYENIAFFAKDKTKLSGWFIPAVNSKGVILFCHGNAGNISHRMESIQIFNKIGFDVFIFDYRGYGESKGKPSEKGCYLDAEAAWNYLIEQKKYSSDDIIIFGRSLGGTIASWLAQIHTPRKIILESTFTSVQDLGAELYPYLPIKYISRFDFNAIDYIQNVKCPVLIIHSRDDEIIPFTHGKKLYKYANEPKYFFEIQGSHNDGFFMAGDEYIKKLENFIITFNKKKTKR